MLSNLALMASRDWSISTARIATEPTTVNCQNGVTFSITNRVIKTAIINAPMIGPTTAPDPPNRLTPPIIKAAIDDKDNGLPITSDPAARLVN